MLPSFDEILRDLFINPTVGSSPGKGFADVSIVSLCAAYRE